LARATERVERQEDMMASALAPDERRAMIDMLRRVETALCSGGEAAPAPAARIKAGS
jgi:hypothetical protein